MFISAADLSSSDSQSSSDEGEQDVVASSSYHVGGATQPSANPTNTPPLISRSSSYRHHEVPDAKDIPDIDTGSHANMMTAALLEFYCLSRATDILNAQEGSVGNYTRDSPEVQYLGKRMYAFKSQFLSSHGVLASGVDKEELGTTRQYYRDNLDLLGVSALEGLDLNDRHVQQSPISTTRDLALTTRSSNMRVLKETPPGGYVHHMDQRREILGLKEFSGGRNVTPLEDIRLDVTKLPHRTLPFTGSSPVSLPLFSSQPPSPINAMSRYATEFSEVGILGRGSYGEVYHVQNHIDGQNYAVKKIPLSQRRLEQLQFGGNQLETIMKEIRTLARLEHTNVVRYYGAWVEKAHFSQRVSNRPTSFASNNGQTAASDQEQTHSYLPSHDPTDDQSYGVIFEHSESSAAETHSDSMSQRSQSTTTSRHSKRSSGHSIQFDEEIESITRGFSVPSQGQLSTFGANDSDIFTDGLSHGASKMQVQRRARDGTNDIAVVLHIQMSLHPTSLGSYLNPQQSEKEIRRHCYHLVPSLRLMLSIISGVEYIHSKGIVHRDLKPANIFLSSLENSNLEICGTCQKQPESDCRYYHPRIGDFGLVADISHIDDCSLRGSVSSQNMNRVVGTEFYRPPTNSNSPGISESDESITDEDYYTIDERLDVYALGVILFELLYRLGTKMERQMVLSELTRGRSSSASIDMATQRTIFPSDFAEKIDMGQVPLEEGMTVAGSIMTCIRGMLEPRSRQRWRCSHVKKHLVGILSALERAS